MNISDMLLQQESLFEMVHDGASESIKSFTKLIPQTETELSRTEQTIAYFCPTLSGYFRYASRYRFDAAFIGSLILRIYEEDSAEPIELYEGKVSTPAQVVTAAIATDKAKAFKKYRITIQTNIYIPYTIVEMYDPKQIIFGLGIKDNFGTVTGGE